MIGYSMLHLLCLYLQLFLMHRSHFAGIYYGFGTGSVFFDVFFCSWIFQIGDGFQIEQHEGGVPSYPRNFLKYNRKDIILIISLQMRSARVSERLS